MSLRFGYPLGLALVVLAVPTVLWARRSLAGLGRRRGGAALGVRLAILLLLVAALADAQWLFTQDDLAVIYLVDLSLSIPPDAQKKAVEYVLKSQRGRRHDDQVGLILFGRTAALERRPEPLALLEPKTVGSDTQPGRRDETATLQSVISPQRTNIAGALRLALAAFPPGGRRRVVLVSDGNENVGAAVAEAENARKNGVRVDVFPVHYTYDHEVMVEKVTAPSEVEKGQGFEVRTVVTASAPERVTLRLYENETLIDTAEVTLKEGRNVFVAPRALQRPGYYAYRAVVSGGADMLYANNEASAFAVVRGQGRVLYVEGDQAHSGPLRAALQRQGLDVTELGPAGLPLTLGQIMAYDVLILSNVPAGSLGENGMRAVELAVKDWGVGLVMVGGENAYGPGGYQDSPIEKALPVSMDLKERRVMPAGALVIILHTCEIAQGNYWAQQVALAALRVLSPTDEFGVIYYDWSGGEKWLFPLQRVEDKSKMAALISNVQPGDMPSFITAFNMAHTALKASKASVKHTVVISDGDPAYPSDAEVAAMVQDKITVSTVGINPHTPTDARRLLHVAGVGQGRYYEPANANELPQIFIKEAATVRRSQIFEEPFTPRLVLASELVRGLAQRDLPPLRGYVVTSKKETAEVLLQTQHQDPLLAHWQYGLGRAVAFTSDAKARWAAEWVPWAKFQPFWAQVVRWASRQVKPGGLRARAETGDDRGRIVVDALDEEGRFLNGLTITGTVVRPDDTEQPLTVEQTGPGRYEADFDLTEAGTHYVSLRYADQDGRARLYTQGVVVPYSSEYRELKSNTRLLEALARATDGRVLKESDDVFARTFPPGKRMEEAWPLLLFLAALLVPVDVFVRRVFLDYRAIGRRVVALAERTPWIGREWRRRAATPSHVTALLTSKEEARERMVRRARKFEVETRVAVQEPTLKPIDGEGGPGPVPLAGPSEARTPRPAATRDEDSYLGRLLRAKREARGRTDEARPNEAGPDTAGPDKTET